MSHDPSIKETTPGNFNPALIRQETHVEADVLADNSSLILLEGFLYYTQPPVGPEHPSCFSVANLYQSERLLPEFEPTGLSIKGEPISSFTEPTEIVLYIFERADIVNFRIFNRCHFIPIPRMQILKRYRLRHPLAIVC